MFKVQCSRFNVFNSSRALNFDPRTLELRFCSLLGDERAQNHADDAEHDGAEEGRQKSGYVKARHEGGGQLKHERVDDQPENAQRQYRERKSYDLENQSDRRVDEPDDDGRDERRAQAAQLDAGKNVGDDHETRRADKPVKQQTDHDY
jgi:hypothetical protein